jgi:para-aminobenzoate synthetase component 1
MNSETFPYKALDATELKLLMNSFALQSIPFLFVLNYRMDEGFVIPADKLDERFVRFGFHQEKHETAFRGAIEWELNPVSYEVYHEKISYVKQQIGLGNSFLTNLTQPSALTTNLSLEQIYELSSAPYKLWMKDKFVVLSPETFVQISKNHIQTFPMKGTIDADLPNAAETILNDNKEMAEHATIVDLLRNDLSMVATDVHLSRYRYLDEIQTHRGRLLQVSSEITGKLLPEFQSKPGDVLFALLPAGSICGAPKPSTLNIIEKAEGYERGYYTGVCGYFDGENLDSAVMIRFVEQTPIGLVFKSGGGITASSNPEKEYHEMLQKVYVPIS